MPLPSDITTITVTGKYEDMQGNPLTGSVTFTPGAGPFTDTTDLVILEGLTVSTQLTVSGTISIVLPCTDNAKLTPSSWTWTVTENIRGAAARSYSIALPHTLGSSVDLTALAPVSPSPGVINVAVAGLQPSADTSGATDTANIQALLNLGVVHAQLGTGVFYLNAPLVMQKNGQQLHGFGGATASGNDASLDLGTTLVITSGFTNSNTWSALVTGAVVVIQKNAGTGSGGADSASNQVSGCRITDLWIDGTSSPATVDGVACYGAIEAFQMERVGCYKITGKAFPQYLDTSWTTGNFPDGQHLYSCIAQKCHDHAFYGSYVDATMIDCHAQSSNLTGAGYGDGFYLTGGHNFLLTCRSDLNQNGFTFDNPTTVGSNSFLSPAATMVGCGTQLNNGNGLNMINSSATGNSTRGAVWLAGCSFEGDGTNGGSGGGGYAGISVSGRNIVVGDNVNVLVYTTGAPGVGSPAYAVATATSGSGNAVPDLIQLNGGFLNAVTGIINDAAPATTLSIGPNTRGYAGGEYNANPGTPQVLLTNAKLGAASLNLSAASGNSRGSLAQFTQLTSAPTNPGVNFTGAGATDAAWGLLVSGDTNSRLRVNFNGQYLWGSGASGPDTLLQRISAGNLQLSDNGAGNSIAWKAAASSSQVGTTALFQAVCNASGDLAYIAQVAGDTFTRLRVDSGGLHKWGSGAATHDVTLQRATAGQLSLTTTNAAGAAKPLDPYFGGLGWLQETSALSMGSLQRAAYTVATAGLTTSGTVYLVAVYYPVGTTVTNISFLTGTGTLKTGGTHGWYGLVDNSLTLRAVSADQTDPATVWGTASTVYALAVLTAASAKWVTTYSGLHYHAVMVANTSGTQPNLVAGPTMAAGVGGTAGTALSGACTGGTGTGQTTPPAADGSVTFTLGSDGSKNFMTWGT